MKRQIRNVYFNVKWWLQKWLRGFSDPEWWSLDTAIAEFTLPRLRHWNEHKCGHPADISFEEWTKILSEIEWAMEKLVKEQTRADSKAEYERQQAAFELFGKYFTHFWD